MTTCEANPWDKVEDALKNAVSISWDGCHKIYIAMDGKSHDKQVQYGYKPLLIDDNSLNTLKEWFGASCGLRFINSISNGNVFNDLIPQFHDC